MTGVLAPSTAQNRSVEEIYQKKTQLEHILLRPDTYVGSIEFQMQSLWVHDGEKMQLKTVNYVPGLYKIFDEILVNAADNKVRDPSMDTVKVDIDEVTGRIKVWNNGSGVPVEIHKKENVYVPELIFGHLLTSSNYEDNQKKVTGGRNGYGAKLANIFSTEFIIETCDGSRQKRYRQVFSKNMSQKKEPKITACKATDNWTCVEFKPDFGRFNMEGLDADTVSLMRKRTYDLSGVLGSTVKVFYNGERLPVKTFQDYVSLYLGPKGGDDAVPRVHEKVGDRWEVVVSPTDGQFQQVSFVNSICTPKGGTHVKMIVDQITKHVLEVVGKKHKGTDAKDFMVRNHLSVFVNCQIVNPAFDSQTKETLTLKASAFGSKCELSSKFLDAVCKSGVVNSIVAFATFKQSRQLKKTDGHKLTRLTGIPKLDDANDAGGRNSEKCTLILTEGDSAKALAISGLSVVGRDQFGVFPLRGKLLNVREATAQQVSKNAEITALKRIIGLQHGKTYSDTRSLRYGKVMIMTDQDHDGSHIKGLIMNFLHHFYPSLLKLPGFLVEFITPIVKAKKGTQVKAFYTMPEYEQWKAAADRRGWHIKYYKGLGSSKAEEVKQYFADLKMHRKTFVWEGDGDGDSLELAFSKKKVEERKQWLREFVPGTYLDHSVDRISYSTFVNRELILFSRADLERSIPSMLDGLKPGQRKIMYCVFKRNLKKEVKVSQLSGHVLEHADYHHGDSSLQSTIVGLAQDFVGSNNINLLDPGGQFGTRIHGGKDAASARYLFTKLEVLTRHLFNEQDDPLLEYQVEDGHRIEPKWYLPILPLVLVNGADGIGTGWSTNVPNYNPHDIVANLKRLLRDEPLEPMAPWYRGFKGEIYDAPGAKADGSKNFVVSGLVNQEENGSLRVTELPIRKWTGDFKEGIEVMMGKEADAPTYVNDFRDHSTEMIVDFEIQLSENGLATAQEKGLVTFFKLQSRLATSNMMLFDSSGRIQKYIDTDMILKHFYDIRLQYYGKRKAHMLATAELDLQCISNKMKFILAVVEGRLKVSNRKRKDVEADLDRLGFDRVAKSRAKGAKESAAAAAEENDGGDSGEDDDQAGERMDGKSFDYLLGMPINSLTLEKVQALQKEKGDKEARVEEIRSTPEKTMWLTDLDAFLAAYDAWLEDKARIVAETAKARKAAGALPVGPRKGPAKKAPAKKGTGKQAATATDKDAPAAAAPAAQPVATVAGSTTAVKGGKKAAGAAGGTAKASGGTAKAAGGARGKQAAAKGTKSIKDLLGAAKPKAPTAAAVETVDESDDDADFEEPPKKGPTAAAGSTKGKKGGDSKAKAAKRVLASDDDESEGYDSEVSDASEAPRAPKGKVRRLPSGSPSPPPAGATAPDHEEQAGGAASQPSRRAPQRGAAAKKPVYTLDSSDAGSEGASSDGGNDNESDIDDDFDTL